MQRGIGRPQIAVTMHKFQNTPHAARSSSVTARSQPTATSSGARRSIRPVAVSIATSRWTDFIPTLHSRLIRFQPHPSGSRFAQDAIRIEDRPESSAFFRCRYCTTPCIPLANPGPLRDSEFRLLRNIKAHHHHFVGLVQPSVLPINLSSIAVQNPYRNALRRVARVYAIVIVS